ncbi:MAG TPA: hypothetical protein GXX49_07245 [Clostridiaceae bacterium]|nr:hypothetical protein [Clostridiaceae bacterium]
MILQKRNLKEMSTGDILDYSIELYRRNLKKLCVLSFIFVLPFSIIYTMAGGYIYNQFVSSTMIADPEEVLLLPYKYIAYYMLSLGIGALNLVYGILLRPVMEAAVVTAVYDDITEKQSVNIKELIKNSFRLFPRLLGNRALSYLIVSAISFVGLIVFYIFLFAFIFGFMAATISTPGSEPNAFVLFALIMILTILGIALLLVIVYFSLRFGFGVQSIIIEKKKAIDALTRSWEVTKKSFLKLMIPYLMGMALFFFFPVILATGVQALSFFNMSLFTVLNTVVQLLNSVLNPYIVILMTLIFINQKIRNEGFDLEVKIDRLLENEEQTLC